MGKQMLRRYSYTTYLWLTLALEEATLTSCRRATIDFGNDGFTLTTSAAGALFAAASTTVNGCFRSTLQIIISRKNQKATTNANRRNFTLSRKRKQTRK